MLKIAFSLMLVFNSLILSQHIVPDSTDKGKPWLVYGWYKQWSAPVDAMSASLFFDSNWTYYAISPYEHLLSTPDLFLSPESCGGNTWEWLFKLDGLENRRVLVNGTYGNICDYSSFLVNMIDSNLQDTATLFRIQDSTRSSYMLRYLDAKISFSGLASFCLRESTTAASHAITRNYDSTISGKRINELISSLNRNEYWLMDSIVSNSAFTGDTNVDQHQTYLYCNKKGTRFVLGGSDTTKASSMITDILALLTDSIIHVGNEAHCPVKTQLLLNVAPNPMRYATNITFTAPINHTAISITIYNASGAMVKTLSGEPSLSSIQWNGRNELGVLVAAGTYICRFKVNSKVTNKLIMVLR